MDKIPHLLEAAGVELEYVIVDDADLSIKPIADEILKSAAKGEIVQEAKFGNIAWSNEFTLHVIEIKTIGPQNLFSGLEALLFEQAMRINALLKPFKAMLLPGGSHPLMRPKSETKLWPHGNREIYDTYERIFGCRSHGWSNLQSTHLNISFNGDEEFSRLHAAVRLVLPLIPALCASTPVIGGKPSGWLDTRLVYYAQNQSKIPSISGEIIPEPGIRSRQEYEDRILKPMYRDIAVFDKKGLLQEEWLNSRGAIARFERSAVEIRIIDSQECIQAEIAVCGFIAEVIRTLVEERWIGFGKQRDWDNPGLVKIYRDILKQGMAAIINDRAYLAAFGYKKQSGACTAGQLWRHLMQTVLPQENKKFKKWRGALEIILGEGNLAERITVALKAGSSRKQIIDVYRKLAAALQDDRLFSPQKWIKEDSLAEFSCKL
ncbi:MAG: glutamate-cysteine ligase family protein [Candidatus Omnitrophota bacterium]